MTGPIQEMIQSHETVIAAAKVAPALGGGAWYALTLNQWVALATLIYIVLQVGLLVPKYVDIYKGYKNKNIGKGN